MTQKKKIAFIKARWHAEIVDQAFVGFKEVLEEDLGDVKTFDVPGAFEMPLLAQKLAKTDEYSAIVCAAFVVDGGIYRHEFVAQAVVDGLMRVQLDTEVPVLSVSLTPHEFDAKDERTNYFKEHFVGKGREAAEAVAMLAKQEV